MDIICISTQNWNEELWTNKQHIMQRLSLFNRILYLNPEAISVKRFIFGNYSINKIYQRYNKNLFIFPQSIRIFGDKLRLVDQIINVFWKLFLLLFVTIHFSSRRILWIYPPESHRWLGFFREKFSIYDCVDDYSKFPVYLHTFGKHRIKNIEKILSKKADIIFTTSEKMFEEKKRYNPNTFLVGNVADFDHFNTSLKLNYSEPKEFKGLPHPRLLFFGALSSFKLDFKLLIKLAETFPKSSIILIGPAHTGELDTDLSQLERFSNIHILGERSYNLLPSYIKHSDLLILPYRFSEYIESCFPIKFFEYLASGKPVLTTAIPELKVYKDVVPEGDTPEEFLSKCSELIESPPSGEEIGKMVELAREHTWETRINRIAEAVKKEGYEIKYPSLKVIKGRKKVRIGIDARLMNYSRMGIGEYVDNLVKGLGNLDRNNQYYLYFDSDPESLELPSNFIIRVLPRENAFLWLNIRLLKACKEDSISMLHSPVNFEMPLSGRFKKIVTIHDLVPVVYPEFATKRFSFFARNLYPSVVKQADVIITDSINSMSDIIRNYPISSRKVNVVYLGIKEAFRRSCSENEIAAVKEKFSINRRYILNTGGFEPRKNVLNLIKGFERFSKENPEILLVIPGKKSHTYQMCESLSKELDLEESIRFPGLVSEQDLITLYNGCEIFIYPSLYEGFGLPPLEAMASGKPVIISPAGSLKEIFGDSVKYIDPLDPHSIYNGIKNVYGNPKLREELIQRGKMQEKKYNWEQTVEDTHRIYLRTAG